MNKPIPDRVEIYWKSSESMDEINDTTVSAVITSPPYWDLKDYGHENQIGIEDESYGEYHKRLDNVWEEVHRVLNTDGDLWIVVDTVMRRGDLTLLPLHTIEHVENVGFFLQNIVKWYKPTAIAGMTDRNVVNKKEYILHFSKAPSDNIQSRDLNSDKKDPAINGQHSLGDLWRFPVKRGSVGNEVSHKAPYPIDLIERIVKLTSSEGEKILDPFLGSGTTALAAHLNNRSVIGYEINQDFEEVIENRFRNHTKS